VRAHSRKSIGTQRQRLVLKTVSAAIGRGRVLRIEILSL
jgi:hypothetical protein